MPDVLHLVKIHTSPERVYQALTTAARHPQLVDPRRRPRFKGRRNGRIRLPGPPDCHRGEDRRAQAALHVAWTTISSNAPGGWEGTTITFDLQPEGGNTVLSFAHRGFEQANEGYERVAVGWEYYLGNLQRYLASSQMGFT